MSSARDIRDVRDVRDIRDVNVLKKTKDLMLITYLNPTYLWCFSPDPRKSLSELSTFQVSYVIVNIMDLSSFS